MIHRTGVVNGWAHSNGTAKISVRRTWLGVWILGAIGLLLLFNLGCGGAAEEAVEEARDAAAEAAEAAGEAIEDPVCAKVGSRAAERIGYASHSSAPTCIKLPLMPADQARLKAIETSESRAHD